MLAGPVVAFPSVSKDFDHLSVFIAPQHVPSLVIVDLIIILRFAFRLSSFFIICILPHHPF